MFVPYYRLLNDCSPRFTAAGHPEPLLIPVCYHLPCHQTVHENRPLSDPLTFGVAIQLCVSTLVMRCYLRPFLLSDTWSLPREKQTGRNRGHLCHYRSKITYLKRDDPPFRSLSQEIVMLTQGCDQGLSAEQALSVETIANRFELRTTCLSAPSPSCCEICPEHYRQRAPKTFGYDPKIGPPSPHSSWEPATGSYTEGHGAWSTPSTLPPRPTRSGKMGNGGIAAQLAAICSNMVVDGLHL